MNRASEDLILLPMSNPLIKITFMPKSQLMPLEEEFGLTFPLIFSLSLSYSRV
jgi:hypothetical protein